MKWKKLLKKKSYLKSKRKLSSHFGLGDIFIEDFKYNPVHSELTLDEWRKGLENDYYLDTGTKFYLVNIKLSLEVDVVVKSYQDSPCDYIFIKLNDEHYFDSSREWLLLEITKIIKIELSSM